MSNHISVSTVCDLLICLLIPDEKLAWSFSLVQGLFRSCPQPWCWTERWRVITILGHERGLLHYNIFSLKFEEDVKVGEYTEVSVRRKMFANWKKNNFAYFWFLMFYMYIILYTKLSLTSKPKKSHSHSALSPSVPPSSLQFLSCLFLPFLFHI